ncbi:MAG: thiamine pyrophosphate-binding protein [Trueperaceae bacterium]|nr:thiamine pyrophosphate-binding protein [Trueperaceae bacterium]
MTRRPRRGTVPSHGPVCTARRPASGRRGGARRDPRSPFDLHAPRSRLDAPWRTVAGRHPVRARVDTVFTVPTERFLPILDALYDVQDEIRLVSTRHEEGDAFAAEAQAKATGRPGVCMVTRGVGATHAAIAIHTAMQDASPLVVLVGQVSTQHAWREAFQELDLPHAFGAIAKWTLEVPHTDRLPELIRQAFKVASTGRPGPVLVGLPDDVLFGRSAADVPSPVVVRAPSAHADDVTRTLEALRSAQRPALLVGREVLTGACVPAVVRLAERMGVPAFTAFRRFDAFPNDHEHYAGNVALGTPASALFGLYDADVVLFLGDRFDAFTAHGYRLDFAGATLIHVASDASLLGTWGAAPLGIVAHPASFVQACLDALARGEASRAEAAAHDPARADWVARCRAAYLEAARYEAPFGPEGGGVNLSAVMKSIQTLAPRSTALVTDAGNFSAWVSRYVRFTEPHTHFGPISGAMGYAVPAAVGLALANADRPVVALAGDGGFPMTMSELAVARAWDLDIVFVVFVNHQYATIRMHQERHYPGRPIASDLANPSFAGIAQAYGIEAHRVWDEPGFDEAFRAALAAKGPVLLEVFEGDEKLSAWAAPVTGTPA